VNAKIPRDTSKYSLCFGGRKSILEGYTDADMAGDGL